MNESLKIALDALKHIAMQDRRTPGEPGEPYYAESELCDYLTDYELSSILHDCCFKARLALVAMETKGFR